MFYAAACTMPRLLTPTAQCERLYSTMCLRDAKFFLALPLADERAEDLRIWLLDHAQLPLNNVRVFD